MPAKALGRTGIALSMQSRNRYLYIDSLRPRGQNPRPSFTAVAISCSQAV